jgi:NAD(P)-dependent dehydrogenase (short-subunit alcohol dehydrogenase family)
MAASADLGDADAVRRLAAGTLERFGRVDILVHCAGLYERGAVAEASADSFDRQFAANLRGPYLLTQLLLPRLKAQGGDIVFVNSTQGLAASPRVAQFAATQHGLKALADSLRDEVNGDGVRVLSVYLGRTATPRQARIFEQEGRPYRPEGLLQPEDVAATVLAALRLPRTAEITNLTMRPATKSY